MIVPVLNIIYESRSQYRGKSVYIVPDLIIICTSQTLVVHKIKIITGN